MLNDLLWAKSRLRQKKCYRSAKKKDWEGGFYLFIFSQNPKMHDFNKKLRRFARMTRETMRMTHVRPQTTRRRHITSEFGLKSRKKNCGGVKIVKKLGGSYGNFFFLNGKFNSYF